MHRFNYKLEFNLLADVNSFKVSSKNLNCNRINQHKHLLIFFCASILGDCNVLCTFCSRESFRKRSSLYFALAKYQRTAWLNNMKQIIVPPEMLSEISSRNVPTLSEIRHCCCSTSPIFIRKLLSLLFRPFRSMSMFLKELC